MTTFDASIPAPQDFLDESQPEIKDNFSSIKTLVDVNHETFSSANYGKHRQVTLVKRNNGDTTGVDEVGLFCVDDAGGSPSLFFRPQGVDAAGPKVQLSPFPGVFAWCTFDYAGALVGDSYNVTSVTVSGAVAARTHKINFTNGLVSKKFFPSFTIYNTAGAGANFVNVTTDVPGSMSIKAYSFAGTTASFTQITAIIWGIP